MNDVVVHIGQGGIGRLAPNEDNIRGLVMNAGATAPLGLALNTPKLLLNVRDAVDIGIDSAYDTSNTVLCYYHIKEFFAENPSGKLWLYLVAPSSTLVLMADGTATTPCAVEKLALATNGEIKQYGIALNPPLTYTPTINNGIDADVLACIPLAQVLMDKLFEMHMPSDIIIEGRGFAGSASTLTDLRTMDAPNVRVVIAQDLDIASSGTDAVIKAHASVGTILGTSSKAKVSDSIAWLERYNISSIAYNRWLKIGFSSNTTITAMGQSDMELLHNKGYLFAKQFVGYAGAYWNDTHSCVTITSDYAYMENVLVINKAVRGVYKALLPKVNSPVRVNASGQLSSEVVSAYESIAMRPLDNMKINEEISDYEIYIDPDQNILQQGKLRVKIAIIPIGVARRIEVEIGYVVSIGN